MPSPLVFISHSSDDDQRARVLAAALQRNGISVWIDHEQIRFGESIPQRISEGLSAATVLLVLVSRSFIKSSWCRAEYEALLMHEISSGQLSVIPVRLDDAEMPVLLRSRRFVDLRSGDVGWEEWEKLIDEIRGGSSETIVNRIPKSPSYHCSLLSMIIGGVIRDFPASTMTDESIASGRSLIDLYRTVDVLIREFQEITELMKGRNDPDLFMGRKSRDPHRKLGDIERDMRTLATAFDGILAAHSELRSRLNGVFQLCVEVGNSERQILLSLGAQEGLPVFVNDDPALSFASGEQYMDKRRQLHDDYSHLLDELSRYRRELREVVARAAASGS